MVRSTPLLMLVLVSLLYACGKGQPVAAPSHTRNQPADVFKQAQAARAKGDYETLFSCYAPSLHGQLLLEAYLRAKSEKNEVPSELLKAHGVDPTAGQNPLIRDTMFDAVADKPTLYAKLAKLTSPPTASTLTKVRFSGDQASGTVVSGKEVKPREELGERVNFRKIGGTWYLQPQVRPTSHADRERYRAKRHAEKLGRRAVTWPPHLAQLIWQLQLEALASLASHEKDEEVLRRVTEVLVGLGRPGIEALLGSLPDRQRNHRTGAGQDVLQQALGKLGDEWLPQLIEALDSPSPVPARVLYLSFRKKSLPKLVDLLIDALKHSRETIRQRCAELLGQLGAERAIGPLTAALADRAILEAAALALAEFGEKAASAIPDLIKATSHPQFGSAAAYALGKMGPVAVTPLRGALKNKLLARRAAESLRMIGSDAAPAVPELIKLLKTVYAGETAAQTLGSIGAPASAAVPALIEALEPRGRGRRHIRAQTALFEIGKLALPSLADAASRGTQEIRRAAIATIGRIGVTSPETAAALIKALADSASLVRWESARTLGTLQVKGAETALAEHCRTDPDIRVRNACLVAIWHLSPGKSLGLATKAAGSQYAEGRRQAAQVLGRLGKSAKGAAPLLITLLEDDDWLVRVAAADALGRTGEREALPALRKSSKDPNGLVRDAAARALERLRPYR